MEVLVSTLGDLRLGWKGAPSLMRGDVFDVGEVCLHFQAIGTQYQYAKTKGRG